MSTRQYEPPLGDGLTVMRRVVNSRSSSIM